MKCAISDVAGTYKLVAVLSVIIAIREELKWLKDQGDEVIISWLIYSR